MPFPLANALNLADTITIDGYDYYEAHYSPETVKLLWVVRRQLQTATFTHQDVSPSPFGEVTLTSLEGNTHTISMWMRVPVSERYGPLRLDDKDL